MKNTIKIVLITCLIMISIFNIILLSLTFSILGCKSTKDIRKLAAQIELLENVSNITIPSSEENTSSKEDNQASTKPSVNVDNSSDNDLTSNKILYEDDKVKIVCEEYNEYGFWGPELSLYIENKTDMNLGVGVRDCSVNDFMIDPFWSTSVTGGKFVRSKLYVFESTLEENKIEKVKKFEFKFTVYSSNTYADIVTTDPIIIVVS